MNQKVIDNCEMLVKNRDILNDTFSWGRKPMMLAGASYYVGMNHVADPAMLKKCDKIIKDNTNILSDFRDYAKIPAICKMAAADDPEKYFENLMKIVGLMKNIKFSDGSFKILAAIIICDHAEEDQFAEVVEKTKAIYSKMKDEHPMLTSGEDIPYAAMIATSEMDTDSVLKEMETCYDILASGFNNKNAVQSICQIISVDKAKATDKCGRVAEIYGMLKDQRHKFGSGFELAVLGALATLDVSNEEIVENIIAADEYLNKQKGFGPMGTGEKMRRMYAALMVMNAYAPDEDGITGALVSPIMAMVIAFEICMIVIITSAAISATR